MLDVRLRQETPIPLDASVQCAAGELLALVGPSGAGKSTVLRAISGLTRVRFGRVSVDGECWQDSESGRWVDARQRRVGMVFQSYALFPHLSVLDNVAEAAPRSTRSARALCAKQMLERVHLSGLENRKPSELSGGEQQRVALARALVREPKVLLLDEPFAAVDQVTREHLYEELADLRSGLQIPVVLVTHSLSEAQLLADRMSVLHLGKTLQDGAPEEVTSRPTSEEVARLVGFGNLYQTPVLEFDAGQRVAWVRWGTARLAVSVPSTVVPGIVLRWGIGAGDLALVKAGRAPTDASQVAAARIEKIATWGDTVHLTLRSDDEVHAVRAVVTRRFFEKSELSVGQVVRVEFPRDKMVCFG